MENIILAILFCNAMADNQVKMLGGGSSQGGVLPRLRRDISLYPGPPEASGEPSYSLHDPVSASYYKLSWVEARVLQYQKPQSTAEQLAAELAAKTTVQVTAEDVTEFYEQLKKMGLVEGARTSEMLHDEVESRQSGWLSWIIHHYLFVRIPLLNPDRFLERTLPYVQPLFSRPAVYLYILISVIGIAGLLVKFDLFLNTFPYFFTIRGFIIYGLAIVVIKILHEFGHAYFAKYFGLHVPTLGVLLLVLWPVLYTDATDAWKLRSRFSRLMISAAGIFVELILGGLSTFGWLVTPPGILRSVFFVTASATWISTLLVNANPCMRFDGYYLLSDIIGIDNMQMRGFAFTRWWLRRFFLGLDIPPPEEGFTKRQKIVMVVWSISTWIYRVFLYTAIAVMVYLKFTKILGIFLLIIELVVFLGLPIWSEMKTFIKLIPKMTLNPRLIATLTLLSVALLWFVLPLPRTERFVAVTEPANSQILYVPHDARIDAINVTIGDEVELGQTLVELSSNQVQHDLVLAQLHVDELRNQLDFLRERQDERVRIPEKLAELRSAQEELTKQAELQQELTMKAEVAGKVYEWDDTLQPGQYVMREQVLGRVGDLAKMQVIAYLPEDSLDVVSLGNPVHFRTDRELTWIAGTIVVIGPSRAQNLPYPSLASVNGGELPVTKNEEDGSLQLIESYYTITIDLETDQALQANMVGEVNMKSPPRSLLVNAVRYLIGLFWQESGF